MYFDLFIS